MFVTRAAAATAAIGVAILVSTAFPIDMRADFGEVDPAYRNAHSDTAWFVRQDGQEPEAGVESDETATIVWFEGDQIQL